MKIPTSFGGALPRMGGIGPVGGRFNLPSRRADGGRGMRFKGSAAGTAGGSAAQPMNPILKAAVTSATMAAVGDCIAQGIQISKKKAGAPKQDFDPVRTGRMSAWGFTFYGPFQHYWYRFLDGCFPMKSHIPHFAAKVFWNQAFLGPVVLTTVFAWTLFWTNQKEKIPSKIKNDLLPTAINGWKFWVPASAINFSLIPLQHQVLYMSSCGIFWNTFLSLSSN